MSLTVSQPSDTGGCATLISDTGSGRLQGGWWRRSGGCRRNAGGLHGWLHHLRWIWWLEVVMRSWGLSAVEQDEVWQRWRRGESLRLIARRLGKRGPSVRAFVLQTGGVQCPPPRRAARALRLAEREGISRGLAAGDSCRVIAQRLGRAPATVSREVARNGGRRCYRAQTADAAADRRAR